MSKLKIAGIALAGITTIGVISNLAKAPAPAVARPAPAHVTTTAAPIATTAAPAPAPTVAPKAPVAPPAPPKPAPVPKPKTVNAKLDDDAHRVLNSVSVVASDAVALGSGGSIDTLASDALSAHDTIDAMKGAIAIDGGSKTADLYGAANDLKNAMGSLVTYTGNPNPATLARFTSQFGSAVTSWNDAITVLYAGTTQTPPLIAGS